MELAELCVSSTLCSVQLRRKLFRWLTSAAGRSTATRWRPTVSFHLQYVINKLDSTERAAASVGWSLGRSATHSLRDKMTVTSLALDWRAMTAIVAEEEAFRGQRDSALECGIQRTVVWGDCASKRM